jgi:hypothetical protein
MNGRTLHRTPDLDQVEWTYVDTIAAGNESTVSLVSTNQADGRILLMRQAAPRTTSTQTISSDQYGGPGKRVLAYFTKYKQISDQDSYARTEGYGISQFSAASNVDTLRYLAIKGPKKHLTFVQLYYQSKLRRFDISNSPALTTLYLAQCNGLEYVSTVGCKKLTTLVLSALASVRTVSIDEACRPTIASISLSTMPLLQDFNFRGMTSLTSANVSSMASLRSVDLIDTAVLSYTQGPTNTAIQYFRGPPTLQAVTVTGPALTTVDLSACTEVAYVEMGSSPLLSSLTMPTGWAGSSKAKLYLNSCNFSASALLAILNNLGTFYGNKSYVDVSSNPGSLDASVQSAASSAAGRGWYVYTGAPV